MIAPSDFRAIFPEFADATKWPDAQIQFWLDAAYAQLNPGRLGAQLDLAAMLYVAHNLVVSARNTQVGSGSNALPGQTYGVMNSKSVDKVSASYDVNLTTYQGAGFWNATSYGQRLYQLFRIYGGFAYAPGPQKPVVPAFGVHFVPGSSQ